MKVEGKKDGHENIIISESSFATMIFFLDNKPLIDDCIDVILRKYIFETTKEDYFLNKKYENQNEITKWSFEDVSLV